MVRCDEIVEALKDRSLPGITPEYLGKRDTMTPVEAALVIKALLREFSVDDDRVVRAYNSFYDGDPRADNVDWVICRYMTKNLGEDYSGFKRPCNVLYLFHTLLWISRGFREDWKYSDKDVEFSMNMEYLLKRYGLKISFSPHKWDEPFDILIHDLKTGALVGKEAFHYSGAPHELRELIGVVNKLLEGRGLAFVDADVGADNFIFVLFEAAELERLNKKYGDVGRLITWDKRMDNIRSDVIVLVSSRGGNTLKVAEAIADELGINVKEVAVRSLCDVKLVFLGSGTYGDRPGDDVLSFIGITKFAGIKVAVFGTSNFDRSGQKMVDFMAELLRKKGAIVEGSFHCRGRTAIFNKDRPNQEDLENAKRFAREMLKISGC